MIETLGAAPAPSRRRRRTREAETAEPTPLPVTRVTAVRAQQPFANPEEASSWLAATAERGDAVEEVLGEGIDLLNRALHALAVASADPFVAEQRAERAVVVRIGYGSGDEVAASRFSEARHVAVGGGDARRRSREDDLRPQERLAAVLGGREGIDACEPLLLRARADLDAGRLREAALQLRVAVEALLVELSGALTDPGHEEDMAQLGARRGEAGEAANAALRGELDPERARQVAELIALAERVLRRRRVLRG